MSGIRRRRPLITALAAAVATLGAAMAFLIPQTASQAADCNGYVALTYDDGPNPNTTQRLIGALQAAGAKATFFNTGQNAQNHPSLVQAQQNAGMWTANHSWSHPHMTQLSPDEMASEISRTQQAIEQAIGTTPTLFRPPYGETNATLRSVEAQYGLTEVIWDVDSRDWAGASTAEIVQAARSLQDGGVILMHDTYQATIDAVPQIVADLESRGLCTGMISPATGRAVAPEGGGNQTDPPVTEEPTEEPTTDQPPAGACSVATVVNAWDTGLTADLTITNTGNTPIQAWSLSFALPAGQSITSGWNATYSPSSGRITATSASYNGAIAPGASVTIGFQASHDGDRSGPSAFALNGAACTAA